MPFFFNERNIYKQTYVKLKLLDDEKIYFFNDFIDGDG